MKHLLTILFLFVFLNGNTQSQGFNNAFGDEGYVTEGTNLGGEGFGEDDSPPSPSYDPDAVAIWTAYSVEPHDSIKTKINTLVLAWKSAGSWAKRDVIYVYGISTEQAGMINWKAPGTHTGVKSGTTTFTAFEGHQGNGSNGQISTYNPFSEATSYALNSGEVGIYIRNNVAENKLVWGNSSGGNQAYVRYSDNKFYFYPQTPSYIEGSVTDSRGWWIFTMSGGTASVYRNNTLVNSGSRTATGIGNADIQILSNGTLFSTYQVSAVCIGGVLTSGERLGEMNGIEAFMDSNGKGVIP